MYYKHKTKRMAVKAHRKYMLILLLLVAIFTLASSGCQQPARLGAFEKHISIPQYSWNYDFQPSFSFHIKDTSALYNISVTVRHSDDYAFSNLWLLISSSREGEKPKEQRVELPLADQQGRWLGSGMDGIYDHRIPIQQHARFDRPGTYIFSFQQDMRTNPLLHIMSVGLRIDKISP